MFYSVNKGKCPGIYSTWNECKQNVIGFKGAVYKKFENLADAQEFLLNGPKKIIDKIKEDINEDIDLSLYTKVFTDGSLLRRNNLISCGYGIYIPSLDIKHSIILQDPKTNNRAELKAIIDSIVILNNRNIKNILICTDSSYSILIFGETGLKYERKDFKNVKNKDLVVKAVQLAKKNNLKFKHIGAHTGYIDEYSAGNDQADTLANLAAVKDYINIDKNWKNKLYDIGKYKNQRICDIPESYLLKFYNNEKISEMCKKNEHIRTIKHFIKFYLSL